MVMSGWLPSHHVSAAKLRRRWRLGGYNTPCTYSHFNKIIFFPAWTRMNLLLHSTCFLRVNVLHKLNLFFCKFQAVKKKSPVNLKH